MLQSDNQLSNGSNIVLELLQSRCNCSVFVCNIDVIVTQYYIRPLISPYEWILKNILALPLIELSINNVWLYTSQKYAVGNMFTYNFDANVTCRLLLLWNIAKVNVQMLATGLAVGTKCLMVWPYFLAFSTTFLTPLNLQF